MYVATTKKDATGKFQYAFPSNYSRNVFPPPPVADTVYDALAIVAQWFCK